MNFDEVEVKTDKQEMELVFTAVKKTKTRNLKNQVVEAEEREEVARIPNEDDLGREIGEMLCERFSEKV